MNEGLEALVTIGGIAFITAPIWYPTWAALRVVKAWENDQRRRRKP